MECLSKRAILYLFVISTIIVSAVECQNVQLEGDSRLCSQPLIMDSNREIVTSNSVCPKNQLMNTLFSIASGKKGISEMATIPPAMFQEKQYASINQNQRPNVYNVVSMSPQGFLQESPGISVSQPMITTTSLPQPAIPTNSMSNIMMGTAFPSPYSAPYTRTYQPTVVPAPSCSVPRPPKPPQIIPLENYANMVQSYPTIWQMPPSGNDFYSYNSQSPIVYAEPTLNFPKWEISPPSVVPAVNTECGIYDAITRSANSDILVSEPVVAMNDYEQGLPFNVHINVPPSNIPAPRITLVSAAPPPYVPTPDPNPTYTPFNYPPPIIMKNTRSSWKKILPVILIALFRDHESGGCCCPCNCACDSDSPTPIPYPIAIPVNNPIINNSGSSKASSRRRENTPDEDDSNNN